MKESEREALRRIVQAIFDGMTQRHSIALETYQRLEFIRAVLLDAGWKIQVGDDEKVILIPVEGER